jgi:hypothetical protein
MTLTGRTGIDLAAAIALGAQLDHATTVAGVTARFRPSLSR